MVHQTLHGPGLEMTIAPRSDASLQHWHKTPIDGRDRFCNERMKSARRSDDGADGGGSDLLAGLRDFQLGSPSGRFVKQNSSIYVWLSNSPRRYSASILCWTSTWPSPLPNLGGQFGGSRGGRPGQVSLAQSA